MRRKVGSTEFVSGAVLRRFFANTSPFVLQHLSVGVDGIYLISLRMKLRLRNWSRLTQLESGRAGTQI